MSKDTPDPSSTTEPEPDQTPDTATLPKTSAQPTPGPALAARARTAAAAGYADDDFIDDDDVDVDEVVVESVRTSILARLGAEALGTFFLVLAGVGVSLYGSLSGAGTLGVALGFGLALIGGTMALGHFSGGHFNPAVTLGAAIAGRTSWSDVLPYWLAQVVGGALAAAALFLTIPAKLPNIIAKGATSKAFFSDTANGYGAHSPLATLSKGQVQFGLMPALLIEIIATALLVGVILCATSRRTQRTIAPFAMGLTLAVLVLVAAPITNAGLNPARSTAAALFSEGWAFGQLWMFWIAPLIGAAIAGLAYRAFVTEPVQNNLLEDDDLETGVLAEA